MPGCSHQATNQAIPERKVSNWVAMDICEVVHEAGGRVSEMFTVKEVAGHFRSIIENLIHSFRYKKIAIEEYKVDQRDEVTGIFIDFILCQEGLV
ncbi:MULTISPECIES: hypothetical protein [unclassified Endozoicomonas]|uniref:hypothetical protein n=1 Tax=unclassified Endozoicomonas TaxID=2644528 RepID=UPI002148F6F4|nr:MULTISPECIES: hypothetical protein [unclassified Endozoicomonas]